MSEVQVAVSIVSHGHGEMINRLVGQLLACPEIGQIILTRNIPETVDSISEPRINLIQNSEPKGFGANHNAAFQLCRMPYFCILNPDIELRGNPFSELLRAMHDNKRLLAAPLILAPDGHIEDAARHFPTFISLARKMLGGFDGRYVIRPGQALTEVDWVAGMFVLLAAEDFAHLGGFDEAYFLYYEDVDMCARAWRSGMRVAVVPAASAIHDARRDSHRSLRHLRWHLASMLRFLSSGLGARP